MRESTTNTNSVNYDFFDKFIRAWAAGFSCQVILPSTLGWLLFAAGFSTPLKSLGSLLTMAAEVFVIPSAIFTAVVAALCVGLTEKLRVAVIASASISLAVPLLLAACIHF